MENRRTFLFRTAATAAAGLLASRGSGQPAGTEKSLSESPPRSRAGRYEAEVPDTLDLAERCALALHGLAGTSDPKCYGQMWFSTNYAARQPYLSHAGSDGSCTPKFAESFPLLR